MWDDRQQVEQEFPRADWDHVHVSNVEQSRCIITGMVMGSPDDSLKLGGVRWYGSGDGVLLIRRKPSDTDGGGVKPPRANNWLRWLFAKLK
jgi:hypothetical protein